LVYSDRNEFRLKGVPPAPVLQIELVRVQVVVDRRYNHSLLKRVGARSPPGHEDRQADRLEQLGQDADADLLEGALLDE